VAWHDVSPWILKQRAQGQPQAKSGTQQNRPAAVPQRRKRAKSPARKGS